MPYRDPKNDLTQPFLSPTNLGSKSAMRHHGLLGESLVLNEPNTTLYKVQKVERYDSKVFNPPSIVFQLKQRGLYQNDAVQKVSQSINDKDFTRFRSVFNSQVGAPAAKHPPMVDEINNYKGNESNKKNRESLEFNRVDNRPKQIAEMANILNWTKKERTVNLTNYQVRVVTGFNDSAKGPHFSKEYR